MMYRINGNSANTKSVFSSDESVITLRTFSQRNTIVVAVLCPQSWEHGGASSSSGASVIRITDCYSI